MKVYMGPYGSVVQLRRWLLALVERFTPEEKHGEWYDWVYNIEWLEAVDNFFDRWHKRKIVVKIHDYDVWGLDHTIALIAAPALRRLKDKKRGAPFVDDDDVPEELRSTAAPPVLEYQTDANHFKRWEWVIGEMIWAMDQVADDNADSVFFDHSQVDESAPFEEQVKGVKYDKEGWQAWDHRKTNGLRLFGKYFEGLWD